MSAAFAPRSSQSEIVLAVTGASGGRYALRILDCLEAAGRRVHMIVSPLGRQLLADECGVKRIEPEVLLGRASNRVAVYSYRDVGCRLASGSYLTGGMVICPCTSNTLGAIAGGLGDNLITRAAHVTLKEARRLILVYREMPMGAIDLENMLRVQRAGGIICPAAPGFYLRPTTIDELIDFVAGKVLDLLGIEHSLKIRWADRETYRQDTGAADESAS